MFNLFSRLQVLGYILVLGSILVPNILYSSSIGTDTKLKLVPRQVPMVPMVPRGRELSSVELIPGAHYLSLDCKLPEDILSKVKYDHGLKPLWWGQGHHGVTFMLYRNDAEDNWSLFMSQRNGSLCAVSTGDMQQLFIEKGFVY